MLLLSRWDWNAGYLCSLELCLVDLRQDRNHCSLDDLVFQSGHAERPLSAVRL